MLSQAWLFVMAWWHVVTGSALFVLLAAMSRGGVPSLLLPEMPFRGAYGVLCPASLGAA